MKKQLTNYYPGILLLAAALLLSLFTYKDYGIAWDEPAQKLIGEVNYRYIFEKDTTLLTFADKEYGAAFELPLIFLEKTLSLTDTRDIYLSRHLATHIFFLLGVFSGYILVYNLFRKQPLAIIGFVMLAFAPRIYAHSFFNTKDIPFLAAILISLTICQVAFQQKKSYLFFLLGLSAGYFTAIRIMGIIPAGVIFGFLLLDIATSFISKDKPRKPLMCLLLFLLGFCCCLYIAWPFLWEHPIIKLAHCFNKLAHKELATKMARSYLPMWFSITNPPAWLLAGMAGTVWVIVDICTKPLQYLKNSTERNFVLYLLLFLVPCCLVIFFHAVIYDDWRHLYFIYPSFVILALFCINKLLKSSLRAPTILMCVVQTIILALFIIKNHPYQHVYFNMFVSHKKEYLRNHLGLDYWGTSTYDAYKYLLAAQPTGTIKVLDPGFEQYVVNNVTMLPVAERKRIQLVQTMEECQYYITNHRYHPEGYDYPIYHSIKVLNNTIICIYKPN